ncbi:OmpA family protein [Frankia sp. AgB1.9]|uniref:OmpA family protein n=1 Tax=unclassified Frankia TaxID=2632575 RepID=UPI0035A86AAE|nr:OmpA family protein [Frankia sp. AgW1.1]MBL7549245.1 OmpA family protein [Frankia sp. AgB1.9]
MPPHTAAQDASVSTGVRVAARDLRLVRLGTTDLALQFEFANQGTESISPADLGTDPLTHVIAFLVDLPRGTGYATQRTPQANPEIDGSGPDEPRASATTEKDIAAGQTETVTLVFPAPPTEATSMLVLVDGFTPVEVPIQAQGSVVLKDDPVLHVPSAPPDELDPPVAPLVCATETDPAAAAPAQTSFRLPSDVLFAFGSSALSPSAAHAIDALAHQITATAGTVTIAGYTDSIGTDADNQKLSQARSSAVQQAISATLGPDFTYQAVGFGETSPVAPNTHQDGSDNPDGRAQNRRVELTVDAAAGDTSQPPPASEAPNVSLDGSPLAPAVQSVTARSGFTLAQVAIHNSGTADKDLGYYNDPNRIGPDGIRADDGGELSLATETGGRLRPCAFTPSWWGLLANGTGADTVPAGGTLVQWALFGPLPANEKSVDVVVGGYARALPARVASG